MGKRKSKQAEAEKPKKRKRGRRIRRLLFLSIVGGAVALVTSEDLRNKALDKLFGAEEEFQYTPPTDGTTDDGTSSTAA